jgi:quinol monooxygenase YgiN
MTAVSLFIAYRTLTGKRADLLRAMDQHVKPEVAKNAAVLAFFITTDDKDPDTVRLFELYTDRAALDAVGKAPWLAAYNAAIKPLLAGPAEVAFAGAWWSKG